MSLISCGQFQESDYRVDEELNRLVLEESELRNSDAAKRASDNDGKVDEEPGKLDHFQWP